MTCTSSSFARLCEPVASLDVHRAVGVVAVVARPAALRPRRQGEQRRVTRAARLIGPRRSPCRGRPPGTTAPRPSGRRCRTAAPRCRRCARRRRGRRASRNARTIRLVAACAWVGPAASRCANLQRLLLELVVGQHAVDHVPALERRGVVEARRSSRARGRGRARRARPPAACRPSRASGRRRARPGRTSPTRAARAGRSRAQLERRRSGTAPCTDAIVGNGSSSSLWTIAIRSSNSSRAPARRPAVEHVYVDAAGEDACPRRGRASAARRLALGLLERAGQVVHQLGVEQVERRVVERDDAERAVVLEPDRALMPRSSLGDRGRSRPCRPPAGGQGSCSGSSS